ncbi:DMT family transporter [Aquibacillus kalidii]|uniref:DMT family transporter n=1 Tax=Aquibacillus kalidii TaxID=2762597 RepID=UPI001644CEA0|nr:SMR family transporter [Aquibacillus kalidii]
MNRYWSLVVLAAVFEVGWVSGLKHAESILEWSLTIGATVITFIILPITAKYLPIGTVYSVFAGLGTVGTVLVEMIFFEEPFNLLKVLLIGTLLIGVVGLKIVSNQPETSKDVA